MKVWNLACAAGHQFEGWFASEDAWQSQSAEGLVTCPMCGNAQVHKRPSAPRLNLATSAAQDRSRAAPAASVDPPAGVPSTGEAPAAALLELQQLWHTVAQAVLSQTEDVGDRFAEEARRIHHGEAPERGIRGEASPAERAELQDEGIEVFTLPVPASLKGPRH